MMGASAVANQGRSSQLPYVGGLVVILAAIVIASVTWEPGQRFTAWISYLALILIFIAIAGRGIAKRWSGLLIDKFNRMSLARFQLTLWTVLILGTILAIALGNVFAGVSQPLAIRVPEQIWLVLGISTTSLVGSPLLQAPKAEQAPNVYQLEMIANQVPTAPTLPDYNGLLIAKDAPQEASWTDLFTGDEIGNFSYLDLAKVQMFFFTLVLAAAYAVAIGHLLYGHGQITSLPDFDSSMTALLAISHAGYLTNKVIPHSVTPT
jgi:hypothetical protein